MVGVRGESMKESLQNYAHLPVHISSFTYWIISEKHLVVEEKFRMHTNYNTCVIKNEKENNEKAAGNKKSLPVQVQKPQKIEIK